MEFDLWISGVCGDAMMMIIDPPGAPDVVHSRTGAGESKVAQVQDAVGAEHHGA